ncbi:MAG: Alpha/beta hydrolase fold protein [Parcubacteria group bacterium Greene1014_15]|nr:MAG: Alpha/beta hydrolase fold protein [Parcubacteria group bacterium Greene1014_15]
MMPTTKSSWHSFAPLLVKEGYHVLAIDLRGHGESDDGPDGYQQFTDQEHEESIRDIVAAVDFLKQRGVDVAHLALIGASIGANLIVAFMALHHEVKSGVLLSAGTKYRGVDALHAIRDIVPSQRLFFVSSKDDISSYGGNYDMNIELMHALKKKVSRKWVVYNNAGHGTNMFGKELPDLAKTISDWLSSSD